LQKLQFPFFRQFFHTANGRKPVWTTG
jgi:hypothetical protein